MKMIISQNGQIELIDGRGVDGTSYLKQVDRILIHKKITLQNQWL